MYNNNNNNHPFFFVFYNITERTTSENIFFLEKILTPRVPKLY